MINCTIWVPYCVGFNKLPVLEETYFPSNLTLNIPFPAFPTCEPLTQFSCSNGRCISVKWRCDSGKQPFHRLPQSLIISKCVCFCSHTFSFVPVCRWRLRRWQRWTGMHPVLLQHPVPLHQWPLHPGPLGLWWWQRLRRLQRREHDVQRRNSV